jgi:hypothetical protein
MHDVGGTDRIGLGLGDDEHPEMVGREPWSASGNARQRLQRAAGRCLWAHGAPIAATIARQHDRRRATFSPLCQRDFRNGKSIYRKQGRYDSAEGNSAWFMKKFRVSASNAAEQFTSTQVDWVHIGRCQQPPHGFHEDWHIHRERHEFPQL